MDTLCEKTQNKMNPMKEAADRELTAGVSAVVACHNSSQVIEPTIKALLNQKINGQFTFEIIVVDNNCTDDTVEKVRHIYREYRRHNQNKTKVNLIIIREEEAGTAFARKTAVLRASCNIISLIDDDNILQDDWIQKVFYLFKSKPEVGVIGGYNQPYINGNKPAWFETFQQSYACGPQAKASSYVTGRKYVYGAGSSYRTEVLLHIYNSRLPLFLTGKKAGAFLMSGNDSELCHRAVLMGWEIWYEETLCLKHNLDAKRLTWESLCNIQAAHSAALIILDVYRALIERRKTRNYYGMFFNVIKNWLAFLLRHLRRKTIKEIKQEGAQGSISHHHYKGMLKSAVIYRPRYSKIKNKILHFYKNNNFSTFIPQPPQPPAAVHKKRNKRDLFSKLSKTRILIIKPFIKRELSKYLNSFTKIDKRKAGKIIASASNPLLKDIEYGNKYRLLTVFFKTVEYNKKFRYVYLLWESLKEQEMEHHLALTIVDPQKKNRFWIRPAFGELNTTIEPGEFIFGIIEIPGWLMDINHSLGIRLIIPGDHGLEIEKGTTDMNKTRLLIPLEHYLQKKQPGVLE